MKIFKNQLTLFSKGNNGDGPHYCIVAWHWSWSITWRWLIWWEPKIVRFFYYNHYKDSMDGHSVCLWTIIGKIFIATQKNMKWKNND